MAECLLSDVQAEAVVEKLPERFDTLDFICECPYSGGTRTASACPAVAARGSRSVCGRRLSAYQQLRWSELAKDNTVSPARWTKGTTATVPANKEVVAPSRSQRSKWDQQMRARQVRWKCEVAGVTEVGQHLGADRDYLFPDDLWFANLLPDYQIAVTRSLARHQIARHQFTHHVMSSQVFALNLAAPFFENPVSLTAVIKSVLPAEVAATVAGVTRVEPEYDGDTNYFNEPGARGTNRTSSDLAVWWQDFEGAENLILIEVKFSEQEFGGCSKGRAVRTPCQDAGAGLVAACGAGCPLRAAPHLRTYWELIAETKLFADGVFAFTRACPFYQDGYQLMRNQLLAAVIEDDPRRPERRVDFAVLYHDGNPDILRPKGFPGAERGLTAWRDVIRRGDRFHIWPASEWIAAAPDELRTWRERVAERYFDDEAGVRS